MERDSWDDIIDEIEASNIGNYFTIKCNDCGKEVKLKNCFKDQEYKGIDIFDLPLGGILISCECGNEIRSEERI